LEWTRDLFVGWSDEPCSGATRLVPTDSGGCPTSTRRLDGSAALPQLLGGYPSDLRCGRGRPLAPACGEGNLYVRGSAASDNQRLEAPRGGARIRLLRRARHRRRACRSRPRRVPLQGVRVRAVGAVEEMARWQRPLLRPVGRVDSAG
jgi:hypothetical protein